MNDGNGPIRVHVLIDLRRRPEAGGHVKSWERLAEAAAGMDDTVELSVHFSGSEAATVSRASNVRYVTHKPIFSTSRLPFLADVPEHADLAPHHPELGRSLEAADLIHTTDAYFVFARTAERVARRRAVPLVTSIHTDTPRYTSVFTAATIERLFGAGPVARLLNDGVALPGRAEARMRRRLALHRQKCAAVVVSRPDEIAAGSASTAPVTLLRRGVDRDVFRTRPAEREWLEATFDIPRGRTVAVVVGRLDRGKNIMTIVEAIHALAAEGLPLHLLCLGEGPERGAIFQRLGGMATCPGTLAPADLARVYASADIVAHPSLIEESSNVVLEALACGRPLLVAGESGSGRFVTDGETGLVVDGGGAEAWTRAVWRITTDERLRARLGAAAATWAQAHVPSWRDVLVEDLVPVWRGALRSGARSDVRAAG